MTLLEVVVAMGLVFVALLALAGLTTTAMKGASFGKHLTIATTLAQERLEEIKREGYRRNLAGVLETLEAYKTIPDYSLYQRITNIQPNIPIAGLQKVLVKVAWADDQHAVTLSTMLAE
ncbi:MAG: hypothetical protein VST68_10530 [Nitrospirota bacterium]|nr:hypothetical protein [Nitrospirota bacterium]